MKKIRYIFLALLILVVNVSSVLANTQGTQSMDFVIQLNEFIKIETVSNAVLTANITDRTGNLYSPLSSRFKVISNTSDRKTLYLKANTITEGGNEEALFEAGGRVYIAFANLEKRPTSEALANCKMSTHPKDSPGVVAYPVTSILGPKHNYNRSKGLYEIYVENGTTFVTVNVGSNVLKSSFSSNDPNGFYQATLSLTESDI